MLFTKRTCKLIATLLTWQGRATHSVPRLPILTWLRRAHIGVPALQARKILMVLLERRFWEPADPSLTTNPNEEMWILESTGEVFGEYSDYLKALYLTKSRVWSSVYTGVSNLTYQEALLEDERGRALARKVRPSYACPLPEVLPSASIF